MASNNKKVSKAAWADSPLPMTVEEIKARGWHFVDVVIVTGDAYVDHPSFAMAILGRVLEQAGYRVAILSQPDWHSCKPWQQFGRPRLFFAISSGNMDSMLNHYTANRKVRNDDAYSPEGKIGLRPDRATLSYCQRAREAYPGTAVITGGVEASLRRLAHYDYWSDKVRRSILLDSKADLLVYGMGEEAIVEIAERLSHKEPVSSLRNIRGTAFALGANETVPIPSFLPGPLSTSENGETQKETVVKLPSYEAVCSDREPFIEATRLIFLNTNPYSAKVLIQYHGKRAVVVNPPRFPLSSEQMDAIYDLPFTRQPHPSYRQLIPAYEMIQHSITVTRGCFGGCSFCSLTMHQGRIVQCRSPESILREVEKLARTPGFKGVISDVGGPTANMFKMGCKDPQIEKRCQKLSCLYPTICRSLNTSHGPLLKLLRRIRTHKDVRQVFLASGIRMDLALLSPEFMGEVAAHHVGGHLKVAPEHSDPNVLALMKKPPIENFLEFSKHFKKASEKAGKPKQTIVPYFIASHPGSDLNAIIHLATLLKEKGLSPDQVQDFVPVPMDIATCMYYTGKDPFSGKDVSVARGMKERREQRALLQFFKPENYSEVNRALKKAGRHDLIGKGPQALIRVDPPPKRRSDQKQKRRTKHR